MGGLKGASVRAVQCGDAGLVGLAGWLGRFVCKSGSAKGLVARAVV